MEQPQPAMEDLVSVNTRIRYEKLGRSGIGTRLRKSWCMRHEVLTHVCTCVVLDGRLRRLQPGVGYLSACEGRDDETINR